ncbi:MAG: M48 family metalloprotease [Candidatus Eremiobacteraeota bacterium]|nr:M48 family metalloprotease [Candidatus Eremiobacteraeota bacterium]MCL5054814.1 M48 family metalloprotease [Bacillota bacterium]
MKIIAAWTFLFFASAVFLSLCSWIFVSAFQKGFKKKLSERDFFFALNWPVFVSFMISILSAGYLCRGSFPDLFLYLGLLLTSYFIFAVVKTAYYYYQAKILEGKILKTAFLPSAKLQEVLMRARILYGKEFYFCESEEIEPICAVFGFTKTWGVISKALVEKLSQNELEAVVWHEVCHIMKKDNIKKLFSFFSFQLLKFFPWNRSLFEQWEEVSELSCDQFAMTRTFDPIYLASAITSAALFENSAVPLLASAFSRKKSQAVRRVEAVLEKLENPKSFQSSSLFSWILTLTAGTCFSFVLEFHLIPVFLCFLDGCRI